MSDSEDRTEEPTSQRLNKAREEGQTVHSQEWITFAMLLAGGAALWFFSADALTGLKTLLRTALTFDGERPAPDRCTSENTDGRTTSVATVAASTAVGNS